MTDPDQDSRNREIVEALRRTVEAPLKRLMPEVEPATVYSLAATSPTDDD